MIKQFLAILLLFISPIIGFSQADEDSYVYGDTPETKPDSEKSGKFDWDRVTVGGGLGATFGDLTYFEIAPAVGYYITDNILAGVGGTYIYYSDNVYKYKTNIYGGTIFTEYLFKDLPILAHAETNLMNYFSRNRQARINAVGVFLGGGLKQQLGDGRSYLSILVLWDINETQDSFYPNPIIRGGISIGL
ncbi:MAG: hypothetical protein HYU68_13810 [Bacteroidetes bacterium]|nr:hypothetical protein [Bacteroidota bacterium]